ncbi:uncharacterized protein [Nicotiana tomentosiformis]|uniref:uncharacterized protein n=1 Tax=Nicotiana tomentosiformis TaxID=4098 RepID=UPI00388C47E2
MKSFIVKTDERLDAHGAAIKELGTGLRNLERQVGQIATILSERILGSLPVDTENNPKEMVNVVTLRSGQVLNDPTPIHKEAVPENESGKELKIEDDKKTEKKKGKKGAEKKKEETSRRKESDDVSKHMPALPFPQNLYREKLDKQFERFLDKLNQVNVKLPFTEVLSQIPAYAMFLMEIMIKKRKVQETSVVKLTEHCNAILQNKLPQKKLENELGEIRSAPISLQMAGETDIIPEGIVDDVLVRVDKKLMLRVGEETVTFEMDVETRVIKEKPAASVEWRVKRSKEKVLLIEKYKCRVYPKKAEKKLSAWMRALVWARGMEPDFDSDPD